MSDNRFKWYIRDVGLMIKERAKEAKSNKNKHSDPCDHSYDLGYLMAFHNIIDIMKRQAEILGIDQEDIGLADIDPSLDLT